jgi:hypothetical protein
MLPSSPLLVAIAEANQAARRWLIGRQFADELAWRFAWRRVHLEADRARRGE